MTYVYVKLHAWVDYDIYTVTTQSMKRVLTVRFLTEAMSLARTDYTLQSRVVLVPVRRRGRYMASHGTRIKDKVEGSNKCSITN